MDEKVTQADSTQTLSDTLLVEAKTQAKKMSSSEWITGAGIVLGLTLALFFLFNQRSK